MKNITKIIENCKNNLEKDLFECYENGVFIIVYINQEGVQRSRWRGNRKDADLHYEHLLKTKDIKDIKKIIEFLLLRRQYNVRQSNKTSCQS